MPEAGHGFYRARSGMGWGGGGVGGGGAMSLKGPTKQHNGQISQNIQN